MKKMNLQKFSATLLVATMFSLGAMAQTHDGTTLAGTVSDYVSGATQTEFWVTQGETMPFYAEPDSYIHPNYSPSTGVYTLTDGFTWTWTIPAGLTGAPATGTATDDNYVEITAVNTGTYTVQVEEANSAVGSCAGTPTSLTVTVIGVPTADINDVTGFDLCGNQGTQSIVVDITEDAPTGMASYAFSITETIDTFNYTTNAWGNVSTNLTFVEHTTGSKLAIAGAAPYSNTVTSSAVDVYNNNRTRYTYALATPAGATGTGIVSGISHRSNYLDGGTITAHAFGTDDEVAYIVNPAPTTGPIYHISNSYAY